MKRKTLHIISSRLVMLKETVAVAESVTAGLVTTTLSRAYNATSFLQGGIIVYNLGQKTKHLNVEPIHAEETNCVSAEVAIQMSLAVAQKFCSQWGIAITGYAAPVPALRIKSCFAYYAISYKNAIIMSAKMKAPLMRPPQVQQYFVGEVLDTFATQIEKVET